MASELPAVIVRRGIPKRIHVVAWRREDPVKPDPVIGISKVVHELILTIDQEDGQETRKELVVTSANLTAQLLPVLENGAYKGLEISIIRFGGAFRTTYQIEFSPLF